MKCKEIKKDTIVKVIITLYIFIILFEIMLKIPFVSDDYEFASIHFNNIGEMIEYALNYGNGRLLGNLGTLIIINHPIIKAIIKASIITAVIVLSAYIINKDFKFLLVSSVLFLGISPEIFSQVYNWTSGFQNYVPPVLFLLICISIIQSDNLYRFPHLKNAFLALFSLASQLYAEHFTVIHVLIVATVWFCSRKLREKRRKKLITIWGIFALLGAVIMFSIPKIFYNEVNRVTGYRSIDFSISKIFQGSLTLINTFAQEIIFWFILTLACVLLIYRKRKKQYRKLDLISVVVWLAYPCLLIVFSLIDLEGYVKIIRHLVVCGGMLVYIGLVLALLLKITEKIIKYQLLSLLLLIFLSSAPFIVISPFGERCLYLSYCFETMFCLKILDYSMDEKHSKDTRIVCILSALSLIGLSGYLTMVASNIYTWNSIRTAYIEKCMEDHQNEITVFEYPTRYMFPTYLLEKYYYYDTRGDIKFNVVDYKEWEETSINNSNAK